MNGTLSKSRRRAFTLTELMIVIGLIALLVSMLLPAIGKVRAAANSTACTSNLRQMGTAWTMYVSEHKGTLQRHVWSSPLTPDFAWRNYWPGILDCYAVRGNALLCPTASEPVPYNQNGGFGNARYAWNGRYQGFGTGLRFNITTFRIGSYGYNRYLTAGGKFSLDSKASKITSIKPLSEVPVFLDAVFADFAPLNGNATMPVASPLNLRGSNFPITAPDHWRFLIARHGKGVNACMADGSVRWVPLEDTYQLTWKAGWNKYRLMLPAY